VEPEAKFFNDFSRARACTRAQGSVHSDSASPHYMVQVALRAQRQYIIKRRQ
jgi:hypothetical protein